MYLRTIHVEPPVAGEVVLVEESPVRTEKSVLDLSHPSSVSTDVEGLTSGLGVGVVPTHVSVTDEAGVWRTGENGIILSRHSRDRGRQCKERVLSVGEVLCLGEAKYDQERCRD